VIAAAEMANDRTADAPLIGISAYAQRARWGTWDDEAVLLPRRYADKVALAGGTPVLLPPVAGIEHVLPRLDALVLSGGGDIDPGCYAAPRDPATGQPSAARDSAEIALCRVALELGLPLLGICRGLQVINVTLGGTLHQHLPDIVGHQGHSPAESGYGRHDVTVAPVSRLAAALGRTELAVPTHHHQAIKQPGSGLVATAWASDGIIEAVEFGVPGELGGPREFAAADGSGPPMLAVQWHPEAGDDLSLFRWLVAAARTRLPQPVGS
jgi:putative glutamine amidotransferase